MERPRSAPPGTSEMTGTGNRRLAVISRSLSTIQAGEDGADAVFSNVVGSQVTALA